MAPTLREERSPRIGHGETSQFRRQCIDMEAKRNISYYLGSKPVQFSNHGFTRREIENGSVISLQ